MKDRIRKIIEKESLTNAQFANRVDINPSNVSHILSGRSEPGTEVLQKICRAFPDVDPRWLLLGVGSMYYTGQRAEPFHQTSIFEEIKDEDTQPIENKKSTTENKDEIPNSTPSESKKIETQVVEQQKMQFRELKKVIAFYSDGTFEELVK